jgi:hypothetical protein
MDALTGAAMAIAVVALSCAVVTISSHGASIVYNHYSFTVNVFMGSATQPASSSTDTMPAAGAAMIARRLSLLWGGVAPAVAALVHGPAPGPPACAALAAQDGGHQSDTDTDIDDNGDCIHWRFNFACSNGFYVRCPKECSFAGTEVADVG